MQQYIKWFELAAAVAAILNWNRIRKNTFIKYLAILVFFITMAEFAGYLIKFQRKNNSLFYNFFVNPGLFILYALAFYKGFRLQKNRKFAVAGAFIVILLFEVFIFLFFNPAKTINVAGYVIGALYIACLAVLKMVEEIKQGTEADFFKAPQTYLLLAMIFYYLTTIPHYSVSYYFYLKGIKSSITIFLNYINTVFNYILYSGFALTFILWGRRK